MAMNLDLTILETLNDFVADKVFWFHVLSALANNPLLRGAPLFASLVIVSFPEPSSSDKSKILLGIFGTSLALGVSVWCQSHLHIHLRPVFDDSLSINDLQGFRINKNGWGERLYSFPSDTATAYFAVGTIVLSQRKMLGLFCFAWIFLTVGIGRVALGIHYPSDILAAFFLGFCLVYLFMQFKMAQTVVSGWLQRFDVNNRIYMISICLFSAEAYSLFPGLQAIYDSLKQLLRS